MRRDLDIDFDPSALVLAPPDRSQLREMFRRFEFRNLLNRIDLLDEAVPAAERPKIVGTQVGWREGIVVAGRGRRLRRRRRPRRGRGRRRRRDRRAARRASRRA